MTNAELADLIEGAAPKFGLAPEQWRQIIATLRRPCPYIVTGKEGTSYCSLAERQPSSDKVSYIVEALQCAEYALTHPTSDQVFALNAVRTALAEAEGRHE